MNGRFLFVKSLSVDELEPGMELARTILNEDMVVILSEDTMLTKAHITRLKFLDVPFVYVKDEYELNPNYQNVMAMFNRSNAFASQYREVVHEVTDIFEATIKSDTVPTEKTKSLVKEDLYPMARQSGAIDYLYELNHMANDVYNHSVRVSILSGVIGKGMLLPSRKVTELITAGFLHDIGKVHFPDRLQSRQVETLKGDDFETYLRHTSDGYKILATSPDLSEDIKLAALQHHEAMDGSGAPAGLKGDEISQYARIIAVADLYDKISRRDKDCDTINSLIKELSQYQLNEGDPLRMLIQTAKEYVESE